MNVKMFIRNVHYTVHYEGKCVAHICSGKNVAKDRCCRVLFQFTLFFARMLLAQNGILCEYLQKIVIFGKMLWYSGQRKCFSLVVMGSSFGSVFSPTLAKLCIYILMFNLVHKKYVSVVVRKIAGLEWSKVQFSQSFSPPQRQKQCIYMKIFTFNVQVVQWL